MQTPSLAGTPNRRPFLHNALALGPRLVEPLIIAALTLLYLGSIGRASPLYGPTEVLYQDSKYILEDLERQNRYSWNPQHHLLYHVLVDSASRAAQGMAPGPEGVAYRVLRVFTTLTALAFLVAIVRMLRELGLDWRTRSTLLTMAGVSSAAWLHFTAFDTHALPMAMVVEYLTRLHRICRQRASRRDHFVLLVMLALAALARWEYWRLMPLTAIMVLLPSLRDQRARLMRSLVLASLLAAAGYYVLAIPYFEISWRDVPQVLLARVDGERFENKLMRIENLRPPELARVARAASLHTLAMPVSDHGLLDYLRSTKTSRLATLSLLVLTVLLGRVAFVSVRMVLAAEPFATCLALLWGSGVLFNSWFNPYEPYPWLADYLPLVIAFVASASDPEHRNWRFFLGLVTLTTLIHNVVHFWLRFR